MIRLKYFDNLVHINTSYTDTYDNFMADCNALDIECPFSEGKTLLFTPSRGVELIESINIVGIGNHYPADNTPELYPVMQAIINRDAEFVALRAARLNPVDTRDATTIHNESATRSRAVAYMTEADPLFFKYQRGEVTEQEWLDKITEIKNRFPKI